MNECGQLMIMKIDLEVHLKYLIYYSLDKVGLLQSLISRILNCPHC